MKYLGMFTGYIRRFHRRVMQRLHEKVTEIFTEPLYNNPITADIRLESLRSLRPRLLSYLRSLRPPTVIEKQRARLSQTLR